MFELTSQQAPKPLLGSVHRQASDKQDARGRPTRIRIRCLALDVESQSDYQTSTPTCCYSIICQRQNYLNKSKCTYSFRVTLINNRVLYIFTRFAG